MRECERRGDERDLRDVVAAEDGSGAGLVALDRLGLDARIAVDAL